MKKKIIDSTSLKCSGCSACVAVCPVKAIEMKEDENGFMHPEISQKCIDCNLCSKLCPLNNALKNTKIVKPKIYAGWSNDVENKLTSSSGGIFKELAENIIQKKGVVYGATMDDELNVFHKRVDNKEDIECLKGSKYVQSKILNQYQLVEMDLKNKKEVLFVGTPCQIAGLNATLKNKQYENLYTVDLICHGVPSTKLYKRYIEELENEYKSKVKKVIFRDKTTGWKLFGMKIIFENGTIMKRDLSKDIFMKFFLRNVALRESCYECKYAKVPRESDITLGDYWGVVKKYKHLDDDTGTSQILVNSEKGKKLLERINLNIYMEETDFEFGISANHCLKDSVQMNSNRKMFFKLLNEDVLSLDKIKDKTCPDPGIVKKMITILKKIVKKIVK